MLFTLVKTAPGYLELVGSPPGLRRVSQVHPSPEAAEAELRGRFSDLVRDDQAFGDLPQRLEEYFSGRPVSFSDVRLDWEGITSFYRQVYQAALKIPWGQVASYGQLAALAGKPQAARAVGQAMGRNPWPFIVP